MPTTHTIPWTAMKSLVAKGSKLFFAAGPAEANTYDIWTTNHRDYFFCSVTGTEDGTPGKEFVTSYKVAEHAVNDFGHFLALSSPPINTLGAGFVEVTSRLSQKRSLTIVTHDFSEPTTWWQQSTQVTNEELTHAGAGVYTSAHALWVNAEHPKLFADENLDVALWAAAGYPGYGDKLSDLYNPFYRSWWMQDGTTRLRNHYYPIVQVQPGGTGDWLTKTPDAEDYEHTFDYTLGKVHFADNSGWAGGTKVRATYFWVAATRLGALFEIGPPAGKRWHLTRTEVQLSVGTSWQDTVRFYGFQDGVPGTRSRYKTYANMQSTASSQGAVILDGGIAEDPQTWPPSADNGWMNGGCSGLRNLTKKVEVDPWEYKKPFEFTGEDPVMSAGVTLAEGKKFLTADIANVTFYVDEFDA